MNNTGFANPPDEPPTQDGFWPWHLFSPWHARIQLGITHGLSSPDAVIPPDPVNPPMTWPSGLDWLHTIARTDPTGSLTVCPSDPRTDDHLPVTSPGSPPAVPHSTVPSAAIYPLTPRSPEPPVSTPPAPRVSDPSGSAVTRPASHPPPDHTSAALDLPTRGSSAPSPLAFGAGRRRDPTVRPPFVRPFCVRPHQGRRRE